MIDSGTKHWAIANYFINQSTRRRLNFSEYFSVKTSPIIYLFIMWGWSIDREPWTKKVAEAFLSRRVSSILFVNIEWGPLSKVSITYCPPALYDEIAAERIWVAFFFSDWTLEIKIVWRSSDQMTVMKENLQRLHILVRNIGQTWLDSTAVTDATA